MKTFVVTALALGIAAWSSVSRPVTAAATSCEALGSIPLPNTTITVAQMVMEGTFTPPGGSVPIHVPSFCRVAATLEPSSDSDIKTEVWLPSIGWNGKFQAVGNGGWAGVMSYQALADAIARGYAAASTDTGHTGNGGAFALGHPEKFIDFAYRSEHEMAVRAKAIVGAFYGSRPKYSYWNGCSTGGRQGLAEAQRYPEDFDGIIAGAQANPRTHLNAWQLSIGKAALEDPSAFIPTAKYPAIHKAVLDACDSLDGLKDGLLNDPSRCRFDPNVMTCKGPDGPDCLTPRQVETARIIMSPAKAARGNEIFPGYAPGNELGWAILVGGPEPNAYAIDQFKYVVFKDPNWNWRTFNLDRDVAIADDVDHGTINAVNPNLKPFTSHGGKLIMYHGWSDPQVAPGTSINYYNRVTKAMGGVATAMVSVRLFMVPGMGHCRGGEGPNTFDMVSALETWAEQGKAPERIVAWHATNGTIDRTRPLCPYPQLATYTGSGSIDEAANFECRLP